MTFYLIIFLLFIFIRAILYLILSLLPSSSSLRLSFLCVQRGGGGGGARGDLVYLSVVVVTVVTPSFV